jgi:cytochrome c peroxidase
MTKTLLTILLFVYLAANPAGCHDKNVKPDIPAGMTDAKKQEFLTEWNDGKELFKIHCATCHGIFTKGKDSISNFTQVQIDNYATRFLARDKKNHAVMQEVPQQDFFKITVFLKYLHRDHPLPPPQQQQRNPFRRGLPGMPGQF